MSRVDKSIKTGSRLVVTRGWRGAGIENWEVTAKGSMVSLGGNENVLKLIVVVVVQLREYTEGH